MDSEPLPAAPFIARVYYDDPSEIAALSGYDLLEYNNRQQKYVLVLLDALDYELLEALNFAVAVDVDETAGLRGSPSAMVQASGITGFPCYRTVEETFDAALELVAERPDLASWTDAGNSWERQSGLGGYEMWVLRLTNSAVAGPKPKLFITSSIHAREYTPAELSTRFAEYLIENYDHDADATWLLDYHEIHFLLHANPDGRKRAEAGELWRKNTNPAYCGSTSNNRGADLNRNCNFGWGCCGGSSSSQCSSTYRGASPGSEPETQAIQSYLLAEFPDQRAAALDAPAPASATGVFLDIHSYSELVLWPWGFSGLAPNHAELRTLGRKFAYFNDYTPQQAVQLYVTDGTTIDFAYGELGLAAYTFELGTQFFQACDTFESVILPRNLPALLYAAKVARTPYLTPAGPDSLALTVSPLVAGAAEARGVTATIDDTRYKNSNGQEATQNVAAAEYYVDVPPWDTAGMPQALPLSAVDGSFDSAAEAVQATIDTQGLAAGRHFLFLRGQDADGNWGAFAAAFFHVSPAADGDGDGVANDDDCAALDPQLWAPPSPARALKLARRGADNLSWLEPDEPGGATLSYDVLRSTVPADFGAAICLASHVGGTSATESDDPGAQALWSYLVRARNGCGEQLGYDSDGMPRSGAPCP